MTWEHDAIRHECEAWRAGERFPIDDAVEARVSIAVREDFESWWEVVREVAMQSGGDEEELKNLSYVLALAFDSTTAFDHSIRDECLADRRLTFLLAEAIDHAWLGHPTGAGATRALDVLGDDRAVTAYLAYQRDNEDLDFWAYGVIHDALGVDVERAWRLMLALVSGAQDAQTLGAVAAGPLEEFVCIHAANLIARIEEEAQTNESFKQALQGIWVWDSLPSTLFERLARAAGASLDRPATIDEASQRRAAHRRFDDLTSRAMELSLHGGEDDIPKLREILTELNEAIGLDVDFDDE